MRTDNDDIAIANEEIAKYKKRTSANGTRPRIAGEKSPFICKNEILELVPVTNSTLYIMMRDGRFPKQKSIGGNVAVWSRKEVMEWVAAKLA